MTVLQIFRCICISRRNEKSFLEVFMQTWITWKIRREFDVAVRGQCLYAWENNFFLFSIEIENCVNDMLDARVWFLEDLLTKNSQDPKDLNCKHCQLRRQVFQNVKMYFLFVNLFESPVSLTDKWNNITKHWAHPMALIITLLEWLKICLTIFHLQIHVHLRLASVFYPTKFRCWFTILLNFRTSLSSIRSKSLCKDTKNHPIFIHCSTHSKKWIWNIWIRVSGTFGLVSNLFHTTKRQFDTLGICHVRIYR